MNIHSENITLHIGPSCVWTGYYSGYGDTLLLYKYWLDEDDNVKHYYI